MWPSALTNNVRSPCVSNAERSRRSSSTRLKTGEVFSRYSSAPTSTTRPGGFMRPSPSAVWGREALRPRGATGATSRKMIKSTSSTSIKGVTLMSAFMAFTLLSLRSALGGEGDFLHSGLSAACEDRGYDPVGHASIRLKQHSLHHDLESLLLLRRVHRRRELYRRADQHRCRHHEVDQQDDHHVGHWRDVDVGYHGTLRASHAHGHLNLLFVDGLDTAWCPEVPRNCRPVRQALSLGATFVTHNLKRLDRVVGLKSESWGLGPGRPPNRGPKSAGVLCRASGGMPRRGSESRPSGYSDAPAAGRQAPRTLAMHPSQIVH